MNKKGIAQFAIPSTLISFLLWFFIAGPIIENVGNSILDKLGSDSICPEEFIMSQYKVCFNANGDVIADGKFHESIKINIDSTVNSCHINAGEYDFNLIGCRLDKFKELEVYNLILVSSKGKISLSGKDVINRISIGSQIVKIKPKELSLVRKLLFLIRFT
ncbi:MAG: hypothetical protein HYT73_04110 [Candidatus Aenigmarchaeota archaeon]|nr:hypothetical protein [Candidatus Aenigmarchaeota archaeon]